MPDGHLKQMESVSFFRHSEEASSSNLHSPIEARNNTDRSEETKQEQTDDEIWADFLGETAPESATEPKHKINQDVRVTSAGTAQEGKVKKTVLQTYDFAGEEVRYAKSI